MIDRIEVNLLPAEYRVHKRSIRLQSEVVWPILVAVATGVGLWLWTIQLDGEIQATKNAIEMLETKINQNKHLESEINSLAADKRVIVEKIMALERISVNRAKWVRLMEILCQSLPNYTWIIAIDERGNQLDVEGRTYSFADVATFMTTLKGSNYITGVELSTIEQIDEKDKLFRFRFTCTLNPNAGLSEAETAEAPHLDTGGMQ